MKRRLLPFTALALLAVSLPVLGEPKPKGYIVVYRAKGDHADNRDRLGRRGLAAKRHLASVNADALELTDDQRWQLETDPGVEAVVPDREVQGAARYQPRRPSERRI